jgi:ornithine decarboxylase
MHKLPSFSSPAAAIRALKPEIPVYCLYPERIRAAARRFVGAFPGDVLYAVKCNPRPEILQWLWEGGVRHFDTASIAEVRLVKELFPDAHCYFMHPVKARAAIREAFHTWGLRHFVVDHITELHKLAQEVPVSECTVYVRITPLSTTAVYDFSRKFGARRNEAIDLLREIQKMGGSPAVSFHIGSQCLTPDTFRTTLNEVDIILDAAGVTISVLDVGGGFPATYGGVVPPALEEYWQAIHDGLQHLDLAYRPRLLCEPGRALVVDGQHLITQVHLREENLLYINDGVYGSFSEVWTGNLKVPAFLHVGDGRAPAAEYTDYTVYGPTCDSVDVLPITFHLPADMREGDWIEVGTMGAYTNAISSNFNGFMPYMAVEIEAA